MSSPGGKIGANAQSCSAIAKSAPSLWARIASAIRSPSAESAPVCAVSLNRPRRERHLACRSPRLSSRSRYGSSSSAERGIVLDRQPRRGVSECSAEATTSARAPLHYRQKRLSEAPRVRAPDRRARRSAPVRPNAPELRAFADSHDWLAARDRNPVVLARRGALSAGGRRARRRGPLVAADQGR